MLMYLLGCCRGPAGRTALLTVVGVCVGFECLATFLTHSLPQ